MNFIFRKIIFLLNRFYIFLNEHFSKQKIAGGTNYILSNKNKFQIFIKYIISILLVCLALISQILFRNIVGGKIYLFFYPAVFIGALFGGFWPGLISTLFSSFLSWYFFILPQQANGNPGINILIGHCIFSLMGIGFSAVAEKLHRAQKKEHEVLEILSQSNRTLEIRDKERNELLKKLEHLDKVKNNFFANVSHELRTPLTLILGPVEKYLHENDSESIRPLLEQVSRNAYLVLKQVNDLLDVAKLDAGKFKVHYSEFDLIKLTKQICANFEPVAQERGIQFNLNFSESLIGQFDYDKIQRVIMNLLSNAFKFTPKLGIVRCAVQLCNLSLEDSNPQVKIEVADSGPGIPEQYRTAIFDRFFQIEDSSNKKYGGTGIGLSIVKDFIELQGGQISISKSPEGGALFTVVFPLKASSGTEVVQPPIVADDKYSSTLISSQLQQNMSDQQDSILKKNNAHLPVVLVVEDNLEMSQYICSILGKICQTAVAKNGKEGLEKILQLNPDLIISDIMMPVMSGDEMVQILRSNPYYVATPIILLTAKADDDLRIKMLREGVQDYLIKPFFPEELLARTKNLILARELQASLRSSHNTEIRLRQELEQIMGASLIISEAIASLPDTGLHIALKAIAIQAQTLTDAEYVALGIYDGPEKPYNPWVAVGLSDEIIAQIGRVPIPVGTLSVSIIEKINVRVKDIRNHPQFIGFPKGHPEIKSLLAVPIFYRGRSVGIIYLGNKRENKEFSEEDERRIQMLAARTGATIETACLYEKESLQKIWLHEIFDQMPEGVVIFDECGKIIQQNIVAKDLSNVSPNKDHWGNQILYEIRTPAGLAVPFEESPTYKSLLNDESIMGVEYSILKSNGDLLPVLISSRPVKTRKGTMGAITIIQDIRVIKEVERLREEWGSIIAHDLRQPVATIAMRAELIQNNLEGLISENDKQTINAIRQDASRLNRMIDDLLDLSRIESKRMSLEASIVNVFDLTKMCVENLRGLMKNNKILFNSHLTRDLFANVDSDRFQQIVGNLISNAAKYGTSASNIIVDIEELNANIRIAVTNYGQGILADQLPLLFNKFARTNNAKKSGIGGIGLGLYITKGLVEAHGGCIWVESIPDKTTTFYFTIPILIPPPLPISIPVSLPVSISKPHPLLMPLSQPPLSPLIDEDKIPVATKTKQQYLADCKKNTLNKNTLNDIKIIVVDDSKEMRILTRAFLVKSGANVTEAQSVEEAMSKITNDPPDILITDIEMPVENGYDLINKIKLLRTQKDFNFPIIALTAHKDDVELKKINEAGFDAQLIKPVTFDKLLLSVAKLVSDKKRKL